MKTLLVPITFTGTVEVKVPDDARNPEVLAAIIARAVAIAEIENPDAPMEAAFESYEDSLKDPTPQDETRFDEVKVVGISGSWTTPDLDLTIISDNGIHFILQIHLDRKNPANPTATVVLLHDGTEIDRGSYSDTVASLRLGSHGTHLVESQVRFLRRNAGTVYDFINGALKFA